MNTNVFPEHDETAALARLHAELERSADRHGLLDVAYRTLETPVGVLLLAATDVGLLRVAFDVENHAAVLAALASSVSPRILRAPARLDDAARQLEEYFARRRTHFELPIDLRLVTGFRRTVIEYLRSIGYGQRKAMPAWLPASATHERCARSARPARTTRCRWSSAATGWSDRTARLVTTPAAPAPRRCCSTWKRPSRSGATPTGAASPYAIMRRSR